MAFGLSQLGNNISRAAGWVDDVVPIDLTPGLNLTTSKGGGIPFVSKQVKGASTTQPQQVEDTSAKDLVDGMSAYRGVNNSAQAQARAQANSQIQSINSLLGLIGTKRDAGIGDINSSAEEQKRRLAEQRQATMAGYDNQATQNLQDRTRGYEQVDNFANNSANSLNRVFQGANAGNSSVARLLAPHLVGKAAGSRRTGVTETANQNDTNITNARTSADNEFGYTGQDLENQRLSQERQFRESIANQESDLLGKRMSYEQNAGLATDGTQNELNSRMAQLNALFGQFKPTYNMRATPTQKVDLNSFSVDPAQFRLDQSAPAESRYYAPQLKKKQQGMA